MEFGRAPVSIFHPRADLAFDSLLEFQLGDSDIVGRLEINPEFGADAEKPGEPKSGIRADAAFSINNLGDTICRNAQRKGQLMRIHIQWLKELFEQDLSGVNRGQRFGIRHICIVGPLSLRVVP